MTRVVAIVQARMSSTRLPGKAFLPLGGKPALEHVLERASKIDGVSSVILATSREPSDDRIANWCEARGTSFFRGSLNDVLGRYYECALEAGADFVVRITADCPLLDPQLSSRAVALALSQQTDLAAVAKSFPKGLDTQVFRFSALATAFSEASTGYDREHVGPFIENNQSRFKVRAIESAIDHSNQRWTLDYPEDYEFLSAVFENLIGRDDPLHHETVLDVLRKNPEIFSINRSRLGL